MTMKAVTSTTKGGPRRLAGIARRVVDMDRREDLELARRQAYRNNVAAMVQKHSLFAWRRHVIPMTGDLTP